MKHHLLIPKIFNFRFKLFDESHKLESNWLIIILFIVYIVAMTALMIWQGIGIAPDRYAFVLLLGSLLIKRTRSFILDWLPFIFILISYDFLRGLVPFLNSHVNYQLLIDLETFIFGIIPTIYLQDQFLHLPNLSWYDYAATIFYFLHFALPLGFGFLLWIENKSYFKQFVVAISLLSYAAWATFVIFPSSPPWLSSEKGYLPEVTKILDHTLGAFPASYELPTFYHKMNPNPVAAVPSLHGAYPFLVLLFCLYIFKWKSLLFLPYVIGVWASVTYLGEHY
ncbi:MAG: phosphatase PAP2 family protein, partial [Candidatus Daviesbacteria bacterium]|nr:phosphatase PAP2 family protein [Candidatus Daviesbacteria bacterium]